MQVIKESCMSFNLFYDTVDSSVNKLILDPLPSINKPHPKPSNESSTLQALSSKKFKLLQPLPSQKLVTVLKPVRIYLKYPRKFIFLILLISHLCS